MRQNLGPVTLMTNFIRLSSSRDDWVLYQYHVDMFTVTTKDEEIIRTELQNKKLRTAILAPHKSLFNNKVAYDGASTLFSIVKLPQNVIQL
jgi:hypothetical protein